MSPNCCRNCSPNEGSPQYRIYKEGFGSKIKLDKLTNRNGAMVLKKIVPSFHGKSRNVNQQYNISNPIYNSYNLNEQKHIGNNLSLISK